jgi:thiol-disulfide isomerase/thioredoxin
MKRRTALAAGVAAAAGGLCSAWWQGRSTPPTAGADIWPMQFERPEGGDLRMSAFRGRPLLLNFWATWCPPCVSELPLLDQFHRDQASRGWQVVGLAVDNRSPVTDFLKNRPVSFPIGLAGLEGTELARSLGNTAGALPFSVLFNRSGVAFDWKLGAIHAADLQAWTRREL